MFFLRRLKIAYSLIFLDMSSVDVAVQALKRLEPEDFKVLSAIEVNMSRYRFVPENVILSFTGFSTKEVSYRLRRLDKFGLILRWIGSYIGYALNTAGYDCLAINALVKQEAIEALGKPLGVGKEADVYDALTPNNERIAVKFHRLGRVSFRQTRRLRDYVGDRRHVSWLYQSRLAAEKEFQALKLVYPCGVSVPRPINQNRHVVVMSMIEGDELVEFIEIPKPRMVLDEILFNVRKAYIEAGVIHADLSEFNVILKPNWHILIIDWPQYVRIDHPNADYLLERDVKNIVRFFNRKFRVEVKLKDALNFVKGND